MAVDQALIDELVTDIDGINGTWLGEALVKFLLVEDGLFDPGLFSASFVSLPVAVEIVRATVSDITDMVVRSFSREDEWVKRITPAIKRGSTFARRRAINDFLGGIGRGIPQDWKISGWAQADKDQRAIDAVGNMQETFNGQMPGWVEEVKADWIGEQGSFKGLNRKSMAARLRVKIEQWHGQYNRIAGRTEVQTQYDQMVRELAQRNGVDPLVLIVPPSADARCRWGCPDWAGNEYRFNATPDFPLHPNCVHFRKVVPGSFSIDTDASIDLGGRHRYFVRNLPEV